MDPEDAHRAAIGVVEHDAACLHPGQAALTRLDDPEFELHLARLCGKRIVEKIDDAGQVLAIDACEPALVASVELIQTVEREEFR